MMMQLRAGLALTVLTVASSLALAGCGSSSTSGSGASAAGGAVSVVASFYPLQYVAERVGGDAVSVINLTAPGAEPHDLELTPKDVARLSDADLVVFLSGFQPAVDEAAKNQAGAQAFDVASAARLDLEGHEEGHEASPGASPAEADHDHGAVDPHFWLDPMRLADVADSVATRLSTAAPNRAATFQANAKALRTDLESLDAEIKAGLANCTNTNLVTSHEAFGYLAQRYGLTQLGIAGLSPEAEPDAGTLAKVTDFVKANKVTTIYYETLVSPDVAQTVARSTGATTAVLDPLEGLSDSSAARDYLGVMRANLATLRAGQTCT